MKILMIVDTLSSGGAGRVISELANNFVENNDIVICTFGCYDVSYTIDPRVKHIDGSKAKKIFGTLFMGRVKYLRDTVKIQKPDLIISFLTELNINSIIATRFINCKVIVSERNDPNQTSKSLRILRRIWYPFCDGVVFQTESIMNYFSTWRLKNRMIIANPINPRIETYTRKKNSKRIVMSGRLNVQKNYKLAIDSFDRIKDKIPGYTLHIYGEGPQREELKSHISELDLQESVILHGYVNNIFDEICDAALYLMTSDFEGMPNALMEAMALGIPVVSTNHGGGGAQTLINDGENGILVPINDIEKVANSIVKIICDNNLSSKLSSNAIKIRDDYSLDVVCCKWEEYIKFVLKSR